MKGKKAFIKNDYKEAIENFLKVKPDSQYYKSALEYICKCYIELIKIECNNNEYIKAIEYSQLAQTVVLRCGDTDKEITDCMERYCSIQRQKGNELLKTYQWNEAVKILGTALTVCPSDENLRGELEIARNKFQHIEDIKNCITIGKSYTKIEEYCNAAKQFEQCLKSNPNEEEIKINLHQAYHDCGLEKYEKGEYQDSKTGV